MKFFNKFLPIFIAMGSIFFFHSEACDECGGEEEVQYLQMAVSSD